MFVIDLASRRVQILGSTHHPEVVFTQQVVRTLTMVEAGAVCAPDVLICDRDRKWSGDVRRRLRAIGIRVVLTPASAANANAHTERFVRTVRSECLDWLLILNEQHLQHVLADFVTHYDGHRPHRALGLKPPHPTDSLPVSDRQASEIYVERRDRLGGVVHEYVRAA